jgi:hypothetical protein
MYFVKNIIFLLLLSLPVLPQAAGAENAQPQGDQKGLSKDDAMAVVNQLMIPGAMVTKNAADKGFVDLSEGIKAANAASWALWDVTRSLRNGGKPSVAAVDAYIRLRMRCNTADLVSKGLSGNKARRYPGDEDFKGMVEKSIPGITVFAAKLKRSADPASAANRKRVAEFMETARKQAAFRMPFSGESEPRPPAPTSGEAGYLRKAEEAKHGSTYSEPPWPVK